MVDLNILKPSHPVDLKDEDVMSLYTKCIEEESDVEHYLSLEEDLIELQQCLRLSKLTEKELQDPALKSIISTESVDIHKVHQLTVSVTKRIGDKLAKFAAWVHDTIRNKTVSEKYIIKKFAAFEEALSKVETSRVFVEDVPTFDQVQNRILGIIQVCEYVKELSSKEDTTAGYSDGVFEKLALTSKGVMKVDAPYGGSTYRNLSWNPPKLLSYELLRSPWAIPVNLQKLRNLTIQAKYESLEDLGDAAKTLAKRCSAFREETVYEAPDYNEVANTYNAAYVINKATKQIEKAITREVNNLVINTLTRLIHYKTI